MCAEGCVCLCVILYCHFMYLLGAWFICNAVHIKPLGEKTIQGILLEHSGRALRFNTHMLQVIQSDFQNLLTAMLTTRTLCIQIHRTPLEPVRIALERSVCK